MDRRKFIKSAGIATGAAAATSLATPAIAQSKIDMVIVSTWPRDFPGLGISAQRLAARLEACQQSRGDHFCLYFLARIETLLGNREKAVQLLREAYAQGGDERFWQMHDTLFENQRALDRAGPGATGTSCCATGWPTSR